MFLILLISLICVLSAYVVIRWRRVKNYWLEKNVPHYPPHFVMGSLTFLQRENPTVWMRKVYKEFQSPYVGMWLFWRPALVVNCPEIARRILVKDSDNFRNRFLSSGKSDPTGSLNIFTANDPLWSNVRRRLTLVFTSAKLKKMSSITIAKTKDLMNRIKEEMTKDKPCDLRNMFTDYTTDIIGESAFGVYSNSVVTGDSAMRKVTRDFMKFDLHRGLSWSSIFFFPELVDIFRFTFFPKDTIEFLRQVFREVIEQRGGYEREIKDPQDLLDALLKIKQEAAADEEEMSEDLLMAQAATFVLGGFDTTASTLTWIVYIMAWNPHYQQRLYEEILEAKQKLGDKDFDSSTLSEMHYMNSIIKETLRLYPPMSWLDRIAAKDYKIDDKLTISAGTVVYVNGTAMHMDPKYFPEPLTFNPDRFMPENEKNITPYSYLPFGEGPRSCIGIRFAYHTLRHCLANIILNYEARTLPNSPKPADVEVEKNGMFFMPKEKVYVQFISRQ